MGDEQAPRPVADGAGALGSYNFLTIAEVAEALRVSRMTVYRLVHSGELPSKRVGRSFRIPEKDALDYIEGYWN